MRVLVVGTNQIWREGVKAILDRILRGLITVFDIELLAPHELKREDAQVADLLVIAASNGPSWCRNLDGVGIARKALTLGRNQPTFVLAHDFGLEKAAAALEQACFDPRGDILPGDQLILLDDNISADDLATLVKQALGLEGRERKERVNGRSNHL